MVAAIGTSLVACSATSNESPTSVPTVVNSSDWPYDVENENMVATAADTIIVGTVQSQVEPSSSRMEPNPETQFIVNISETLKGDATGDITVSQLGGFDPDTNTVILSGDDPLLEVGASYVMTLVFDPNTSWYTASPATNGVTKISDPSEGQRQSGEPPAVADMKNAIANPVAPEPDE